MFVVLVWTSDAQTTTVIVRQARKCYDGAISARFSTVKATSVVEQTMFFDAR